MNGAEKVGVIIAWILVGLVGLYFIHGFITCEGLPRSYYERQEFLKEMGEP